MIIHLNDTVSNIECIPKNAAENLFTELARSSLKGYHIVIIDRDLCDWAQQNLDLGQRNKAKIQKIGQNFAQKSSLLANSGSTLKVKLNQLPLDEYRPHHYKIGYRDFLKSHFFEPTKLLVENATNDGAFISLILNSIKKRYPVKTLKINISHGGGGNIKQNFERLIDDRYIVCCITDSDRNSPHDTISSTAKEVLRIHNKINFAGCLVILENREIENFIPLDIISHNSLFPQYEDFTKLYKILDNQTILEKLDCFWLFFDIKKGVDGKKISGLTNNETRKWLNDKIKIISSSIETINISGFGDRLIPIFLRNERCTSEFVEFTNSKYWATHLEDTFRQAYWYFVSDPISATI